ncbi:MAG: ferritin [Bacteroidota bacterium]
MLSKTIQNAFNDQISKEFYSAYLYLSMSSYFQAMNLPGCAHWMRLQYSEEVAHALRLFDYVHDREGKVTLQAIEQPGAKFKAPLDVFQQALEHEREVTGMINKLYALTQKENDYAAQIELQWFITEQVEEEKSAGAIVEQLKMVGDNKSTLLYLDRQLALRAAGK